MAKWFTRLSEKQLKINEKNRQKNDSKKPLSNKEKLRLEREREAKLKGASNVFGPKPKVLEKPTPKPTPSKKKEIVKKKKRKNIFKTILAVLAAPFIAIGNFFKSFVSWLKEIEISPLLLLFLTLGITAFYIYMGQTGNVHKLIWKIDLGEGGTIGQYLLNNYDFKLTVSGNIIDVFSYKGIINEANLKS